MNTLLVTGGLGFIGSNFIRYLLREYPECRVVNLDKVTYCGNPANLKEVEGSPQYRFVQGDVCDASLVRELLSAAQAVVHCAAETHVDRSIERADDFLQTNIIGTKTLLEESRLANVQRFVHISTDEVYGSLREGSAGEESPLAPNSPYAASKAAGDLLVRAYHVTYGVPTVTVRPTNNFGPYQYPEKVIPLFVTNLIEGEQVPLYSRGENIRDWLFVEDCVRAIALVLFKGAAGEVYNVGGGNEITNLQLTEQILEQCGADRSAIHFVADRPGHDFRYSLATEKITQLGFVPQFSFEEALNLTVRWYQDHPSWWRPLKNNKFTVKQ